MACLYPYSYHPESGRYPVDASGSGGSQGGGGQVISATPSFRHPIVSPPLRFATPSATNAFPRLAWGNGSATALTWRKAARIWAMRATRLSTAAGIGVTLPTNWARAWPGFALGSCGLRAQGSGLRAQGSGLRAQGIAPQAHDMGVTFVSGETPANPLKRASIPALRGFT